MKQEQGYYVAESVDDFAGMKIVYIEHWKEGVKRVWTTMQINEASVAHYMIFASDEIASKLRQET